MAVADVLIVGGGPAGLSAALTLVRQNHTVLVFDTKKSRAFPSNRIHGVSNADGKSPKETLAAARAELVRYDSFQEINAEVTVLRALEGTKFEAKDTSGNVYLGKRVILANGVEDCFPAIEGYSEAWGKGIFHNPFAQGRQADPWKSSSGVLAVDWIAVPKYTLHLTHLLSQLNRSVSIYTHGNTELASVLVDLLAKSERKPATVQVESRLISRLELVSPDETTMKIHFADGEKATESFLGHAALTKLNGPFAEQLGINTSPNGAEYLVSGPTNATNVKGVYAAGDVMSMFKVWPNAVATGAVTAASVAIDIQEKMWGLDSIFG